MKNYLLDSFRKDKNLIIFLSVSISIFYAVYLVPDKHLICFLGKEDGIFENLTVVFFLVASGLSIAIFRAQRSIFILLLAIVLFLGAGEEISWGQRIFAFTTPEAVTKVNVQKEFNIHNVEFFNSVDLQHHNKTGISRFITINILFKIFWFSFGIILPLSFMVSQTIRQIIIKLKVPVPNIAIGIFFVLNYLIMRLLVMYILPANQSNQYYSTAGEIYECEAAFVFLIISYDFYIRKNIIYYQEFKRESIQNIYQMQ